MPGKKISSLFKSITKPRFITVVLILFAVFIFIRLLNIGSTYIWVDDTASVGPLYNVSFAQIMNFSWNEITGPLVPTLLYWVIVRLAGPNLILLRLVPLAAAVISWYILYRYILKKLLKSEFAILGVLLAACFSIPLLLYSQGLQPSIFYFLSGVIVCAVFIKLFITRPVTDALPDLHKRLLIFGLSALPVFFLNYMVVVVYFTLLGCLYLYLAARFWRKREQYKPFLTMCAAGVLSALPLLTLIVWRMQANLDNVRPYFEGLYYISSNAPLDIFRLGYDALSYVFNFSYLPQLYQPLGLNPLSLPFVAVVLLGAMHILQRIRGKVVILLFLYFSILFTGLARIVPLGGVRHVLTVAPFMLVAFGFGLEYLEELWRHRFKPGQTWRYLQLLLLVSIPLIFVTTSLNFFTVRNSPYDAARIAAAAAQHGADTIFESEESGPLAYYDFMQGNPITNAGLKIQYLNQNACPPADRNYLLVTYRDKLDPNWPFPIIPTEDDCLKKFSVTPLWEEQGQLDPNTIVQSVYFPVNGNFVYLLRPL